MKLPGGFILCEVPMKFDSLCPGCAGQIREGQAAEGFAYLRGAKEGKKVFHSVCARDASPDLIAACLR